jgi:hypothetical protein
MDWRPVYVWWLGVFLFSASLSIWAFAIGIFVCLGDFTWPPFDWYGVRYVYMPMAAAVVGVVGGLVGRRVCWRLSGHGNAWAFGAYLAAMTAWGAMDIRYSNCQVFFCPVRAEFRGPSQIYFTCWFIPQQLVPRWRLT